MKRFFTVKQEIVLDEKISGISQRGTVIAIGGGFDGEKFRTIVQACVRYAGIKKPNVLYLPTAKWDDLSDEEKILPYFREAGCRTETLRASVESMENIHRKIRQADIFYVSGGNLKFLCDVWRNTAMVHAIQYAYEHGAVLCGTSSGAMCWAAKGWDDYKKHPRYAEERNATGSVFGFYDGLGLLPLCICPHYNAPKWKRYGRTAKKQSFPSVCLENGVALVYHNGKYSFLREKDSRKAYLYEPLLRIRKADVTRDPILLNRCLAYRDDSV